MPKAERETRQTRRVLPYARAEPHSRMEIIVEMKRRTLLYYQWKKIRLEERLASDKENLQKLIVTVTEIDQQLQSSETCPEENRAFLKSKCEWITNQGIPLHRARMAEAQVELDFARLRINKFESWLAAQSRESDALALELSAMLLSSESDDDDDDDDDDDEDEDDDDDDEDNDGDAAAADGDDADADAAAAVADSGGDNGDAAGVAAADVGDAAGIANAAGGGSADGAAAAADGDDGVAAETAA